jgi:hypothetical protein
LKSWLFLYAIETLLLLACHVCAIIKMLVFGSLMRRKSQSHSQFSFGERFLFGTQLDDQLFVPCCRWEKYAKSERQGHLSWSRRVVWHYALPVTPTDTLPAASINTHTRGGKKASKLPPCCVRERRRCKNPTWANAAAAASSSSSPFVKCIIFYTPSSTA